MLTSFLLAVPAIIFCIIFPDLPTESRFPCIDVLVREYATLYVFIDFGGFACCNEDMKKPSSVVALLVVLVLLAAVFWFGDSLNRKNEQLPGGSESPVVISKYGVDEKNAAYSIENADVLLVDGLSRVPAAPGSASMVVTKYFGNEVRTDLNGDGRQDVVFLLTQEGGGSGVFYYVAFALNTENGYVGGRTVLLGDRIAPQTTELGKNGIIIVNYADRKPGESFAVQPSVGKTLRLKFDMESGGVFGIVANDFEGEADPARMNLATNASWKWIETRYADGRVVTPKQSGAFSLSFAGTGRFSATTDCNSVGGNYLPEASGLPGVMTFENMMSTMMYCEGSQEADFVKMLGEISRYRFTSKGELILQMRFGAGEMRFR